MKQIVIIGNGISGITAARHIRKRSNHNITVISSETEHFYSRTALMYIYMGHMKYENTKPYEDWFWKRNKIELVKDHVEKINTATKLLHLQSGNQLAYDILIIASGSKSNKLGWPGQDLKGVQGLYGYPDLLLMEENSKSSKQAVIVGGGLIGIEMAEMLHTRHIHSTILVREKTYWGNILPEPDAKFIGKHIESNGIRLMFETEMKEINGDENGVVKSITTKDGKEIKCRFVGITTGVKPNISFLKDSKIKTDKGVVINEFFETNIKDVYAIGDCAQFEKPVEKRKPLEQVWYTGRMHGETLAQTLCGKRTVYNPGPWFNSAKFFNIEYQTYGLVPAKLAEDEKYFYWQHPTKDIAVGICYKEDDSTLHGINAYGMRLRHEVFDEWITKKKTVEYVLEHFTKANFDAEFKKNYLPEIVKEYNKQTGSTIKLKKNFAFI